MCHICTIVKKQHAGKEVKVEGAGLELATHESETGHLANAGLYWELTIVQEKKNFKVTRVDKRHRGAINIPPQEV